MPAVGAPTTHNTAKTQVVEAVGVKFAYRRFGRPAELPLVMLQHFRGNLDNWDPALTDALAGEREVILVDYAGVGSSTGEPSNTIAESARQVITLIAMLGLAWVDLLGFSIGGLQAQRRGTAHRRCCRGHHLIEARVPSFRPDGSCLDELLTAVDVEGGAGDGGVRHEMDGERGDVGRGDDAAYRQVRPELHASRFEPIAEDHLR